MTIVLYIIYVFLSLIQWILFFDIILSWATLVGIRFRPKFVASIMDPLYEWVRKYIPVTLGMIDFSPIIILLVINFLAFLIVTIDPAVI